jgi:Flp pilus assembly protein TadB
MHKQWMTQFEWKPYVDLLYHMCMYGLLLYGIGRIAIFLWKQKITHTRRAARMPSLSVDQKKATRKTRKIDQHLELLLQSTAKRYHEHSLFQFYTVTFSAGLLSFVSFYHLTRGVISSFIFAFSICWIPYVWLWVKLLRNRARASYDLLPASNLLLQKYRSQHFNMYYGIMELVKELDGPIKQAFYSILHTVQNRREVEDAIRLFHYQINTTWSLQLAVMILEGIKYDKKVDNGLDRMVRDMTETSVITQKELSENRDTVQLGYFPIFAIPITMLLNQKMSDGKAFHYYFQTNDGLAVLMVTCLICTFSFFVSLIYAKPKNDI